MLDKTKFFITGNDAILVNVPYMEAYIKESFFSRGINNYMGDMLEVYGLFNFRISLKEGIIDNKSELYTFNFPSKMTTRPDSISKMQMSLEKDKEPESYIVLKYFKGNEIITTTEVVESVQNTEICMNDLMNASLLSTVPYDKIFKTVIKNFKINGPLGVQAILLTTAISQVCRNPKNLSEPFRKAYGKGNVSPMDYKMLSARMVASEDSTYAALSFEDPDYMLLSSIIRKRTGKKENYSPLEKIIE